jgi:hypothetical protein
MKLLLQTTHSPDNPTMGHLEIDGKFFAFTIEDQDRFLTQEMPVEEINRKKVYGQTCIPSGSYKVQVSMSPRFKRQLPMVKNVKGFVGIRIHRGNIEEDTLGCILVGLGRTEGFQITDSKKAELAIVKLLGTDEHDLEIIRK